MRPRPPAPPGGATPRDDCPRPARPPVPCRVWLEWPAPTLGAAAPLWGAPPPLPPWPPWAIAPPAPPYAPAPAPPAVLPPQVLPPPPPPPAKPPPPPPDWPPPMPT